MEARYDSKMRECKNEYELAEYLLSCMPIIKEYHAEHDVQKVKSRNSLGIDISMTQGVRRNDIYKKYLAEVEGVHEHTRHEHYMKPCSSCGSTYTKFLTMCLVKRFAGTAVIVSLYKVKRWVSRRNRRWRRT